LDGLRAGSGSSAFLLDSQVFWTTKDRSIVTTFSFDDDFELNGNALGRICEFDSSTLGTVGAPFEHVQANITDVTLSFDCALLASAPLHHNTIFLWAFESCQLLALFDVHDPRNLVFSPNSRQLAYTALSRIHICDIPPDILARI